MKINRNTTTVIDNGNGIILMDINLNPVAISGKSFIDGVVDYLINKVVETSFTDVSGLFLTASRPSRT
jgi:hypothetical protein